MYDPFSSFRSRFIKTLKIRQRNISSFWPFGLLSCFIILDHNSYGEHFIKDINRHFYEIFSVEKEKFIGINFSYQLVNYEQKLNSTFQEVNSTGINLRIEPNYLKVERYANILSFCKNEKCLDNQKNI